MTRTFIGCAIIALLLVRCSQQAEADLAICKSDLTKARDQVTAEKSARSDLEQKAVMLQQQVSSANAQIAQLRNAAQEAAKNAEASSKTPAKTKTARKTAKARSSHKAPPAPLTPEERRRSKF